MSELREPWISSRTSWPAPLYRVAETVPTVPSSNVTSARAVSTSPAAPMAGSPLLEPLA